jgi:hypothetical protein
MAQNVFLEIYQYELRKYPNSFNIIPYEILTSSIDSSEVDECGSIKTDLDQANDIGEEYIRSCDPIKGNLQTLYNPTNQGIPLLAPNPANSYKYSFNLTYGANTITSEDLIIFSSKYGAKKKDKFTIVTDRNPRMALIYDINNIETICRSVQNLLLRDWVDPRYLDIAGVITPIDLNGLDINNPATHQLIAPYINNSANGYTAVYNSHSLIKKINATIENEFIIIGDLHGSYATFIRILLRLRKMNIMNENCILGGNYNIIFLGDIIDRGQYGFEIIMIIFLLKLLNPDRIHINRGNHEELEQNTGNGFNEDITAKFPNPQEAIRIFTCINYTFLFMHSALLIRNPNNQRYIYLSHGGLPTSGQSFNDIRTARGTAVIRIPGTDAIAIRPTYIPYSNVEKEIINNDILPDNLFSNLDTNNNIIIKDTRIQAEIVNYDNTGYGIFLLNSIRWNDFWGYDNSLKFITTINRGRANKLGYNAIERARAKGIDLIIRGHLDVNSNAKIIIRNHANNYDATDSINHFDPVNGIRDINSLPAFGTTQANLADIVHCYKFTHVIGINDAQNTVINNIPYADVFPVITLSTNTDSGRDLTYDSFGILKFRNENLAENNCVVSGSAEETRKKTLEILNRYEAIRNRILHATPEEQGLLIPEVNYLRQRFHALAPGVPQLPAIVAPVAAAPVAAAPVAAAPVAAAPVAAAPVAAAPVVAAQIFNPEEEEMGIHPPFSPIGHAPFNGGKYYEKYLKYKSKYLALKRLGI